MFCQCNRVPKARFSGPDHKETTKIAKFRFFKVTISANKKGFYIKLEMYLFSGRTTKF